MNECPKCVGYFNRFSKYCDVHLKEYKEWLNKEYKPIEQCEKCGSKEWKAGLCQMTDPPSYPEMKVYRCCSCNRIKIESSPDRTIRIVKRIE